MTRTQGPLGGGWRQSGPWRAEEGKLPQGGWEGPAPGFSSEALPEHRLVLSEVVLKPV